MLIVLALLGIVSGAGVIVAKKQPPAAGKQPATQSVTQTTTTTTTTETTDTPATVSWSYNGSAWQASGTPPACTKPLVSISPVDLSQATSILYPGQYRGGNYKAHGGIRFDNATNNNITVKLPNDASLTAAARYVENGSTQYLLDFTSACGIAFRFDHLLTLSDSLQKIINDTLPAPKADDSRTTPIANGPLVASGTVIATAIGNLGPPRNVGVDFGVYDYRQPNAASKNSQYHPSPGSSAEQYDYAICWLTAIPANDSAKALALPAGDSQQGKTSDYCQ